MRTVRRPIKGKRTIHEIAAARAAMEASRAHVDSENRVANLERRIGPARYTIKVVGDASVVSVGDGLFIWEIPHDVDGATLIVARAFVTTVGGADVVVQLRNITQGDADMLSTPITIEAGETGSRTAATQPVIDAATSEVNDGDLIAIDCDAASGMGLGVTVGFS